MGEEIICIPNIGVKNRQMRRNFGIVMGSIGVVAALIMLASGSGFWVRIWLFVLFYLGMIGIYQAREKT